MDKEFTLNHHIGITHVIKIHNKILEVEHLNITVQTTEETQPDPPDIDNTKNTELQLNHINC